MISSSQEVLDDALDFAAGGLVLFEDYGNRCAGDDLGGCGDCGGIRGAGGVVAATTILATIVVGVASPSMVALASSRAGVGLPTAAIRARLAVPGSVHFRN